MRDLVVDTDDMALCEAIIVMAHKLGFKVIAEGVETEEQRKQLCDAQRLRACAEAASQVTVRECTYPLRVW